MRISSFACGRTTGRISGRRRTLASLGNVTEVLGHLDSRVGSAQGAVRVRTVSDSRRGGRARQGKRATRNKSGTVTSLDRAQRRNLSRDLLGRVSPVGHTANRDGVEVRKSHLKSMTARWSPRRVRRKCVARTHTQSLSTFVGSSRKNFMLGSLGVIINSPRHHRTV